MKKPTMKSANYMFRQICRILLSSHESLQNQLKKMAKRVQSKKFKEPEYKDCHAELERLCHQLEVKYLTYLTT